MRRIGLLALASWLAWTPGLGAEDSDQGEDEKKQPKFEQSLEVTTHVALLGEDAIDGGEVREAEIPDLGTALRSEPGLGAARRGPINLEPQVRGLAEGQLLVLVDGTRTLAAGPARMDSDLSHVGPRAVDTVRVVKGPYALAWGPGAFGAIDVQTLAPAASDVPTWGALGGLSYVDNGDLFEAGATVWGSSPRARYWLGHQFREGSDYETGGGATLPGDYTSAETRWGFGWSLTPEFTAEYRGSYQAQDDIDYPGRLLDATLFRHRSHRLALDWQRTDSAALRAAGLTVYRNDKRHRMNNDAKPTARPMPGRMPPFALDVDLPTTSDTVGGRGHVEWSVGEWSLRTGTDFSSVEQDATRTISRRDSGRVLFVDRVWPETEIDSLGLYLQSTRATSRGWLSGTLRLDSNQATATDPSAFYLDHTVGSLDQDNEDVSLAFSGLWRVGPEAVLTAGAGRVVRFPTSLERYSDRFPSTRFQVAAEFLGSPLLDPETAVQFDLGLQVGRAGTTARVDLYYRTVDDYITVQADPTLNRRLPLSPTTVYRYINGDEASFFGAEFSWRQSLGEDWTLAIGASYLRGDDETFDEPAFGVPPLQGTVGLRWTPVPAAFVEALFEVTDRQDRVATRRMERATPGYEVVDLVAGWEFTHFELRGGVRNLLDEEYSDHLNTLNPFVGQRLPEPGRSVFVGIDFSL